MSSGTMESLYASFRIVVITIAICVVGYTATILAVAQVFTPETANGWLVSTPDGRVVGSLQVAQKFTEPRYFWPRPSAVDYNGGAAGGSNLSPTSTDVTERAEALIAQYGATVDHPLPPELAAASGSGLDPHISEHAAQYQAPRVASARGMPPSQVHTLIRAHAFAPGAVLTAGWIVNVLELNLALDRVVNANAER